MNHNEAEVELMKGDMAVAMRDMLGRGYVGGYYQNAVADFVNIALGYGACAAPAERAAGVQRWPDQSRDPLGRTYSRIDDDDRRITVDSMTNTGAFNCTTYDRGRPALLTVQADDLFALIDAGLWIER